MKKGNVLFAALLHGGFKDGMEKLKVNIRD